MPLSLLFDHFDRLITRPGDLPRLNQTILQLAVQGQLVPQNPADEPASELLQRIRAEKERLLLTGQLRRDDPLPPIKDDEIPYNLPLGWLWARVDDCCVIIRGASPRPKGDPRYFSQTETPYHWIKISDIRRFAKGNILTDTSEFLTEEGMHKSVLVKKGTLILTNSATIGVPIFLGVDGCIHDGYLAFPYLGGEDILPEYWYYYFLDLQRVIKDQARGLVQLNLNTKIVRNLLFPLPPLAEQKRIVAKVEALLAQSQALAAELAAAEAEQSRLSRASLHHLLAAPTPADFAPRWHFVASHFDAVTPDPESVDELKQAILQLAVQGKLVEQDSADEPGCQLLERVKKAKRQLAKEGKIIEKANPVTPITEAEIPFEAPREWIWVKLDELAQVIGGASKGRKFGNEPTITLPYLRVANVQRGYLDLSVMKDLEIKATEKEKYLLQEGDLLLTEGGDADKLGRSAIWKGEIADCIHQNHIFRARLHLSEMEAEWLMLWTNSSYGKSYFLGASKQTTNLASINMTQLRNCPIPLPPLAEQKRIVAKVEGLLRQGDELKAALVAGEGARVRLLESALWGVVNGTQTRSADRTDAKRTDRNKL